MTRVGLDTPRRMMDEHDSAVLLDSRRQPSHPTASVTMSVPYLIQRTPAADALVVFVHGFTGTALETWGKFPEFLKADLDLQKFDFLFWGYPTSINFLYSISRYFWTDNPDIATVGQALRSLLAYRAVPFAPRRSRPRRGGRVPRRPERRPCASPLGDSRPAGDRDPSSPERSHRGRAGRRAFPSFVIN